jgi:hypothetical protein
MLSLSLTNSGTSNAALNELFAGKNDDFKKMYRGGADSDGASVVLVGRMYALVMVESNGTEV